MAMNWMMSRKITRMALPICDNNNNQCQCQPLECTANQLAIDVDCVQGGVRAVTAGTAAAST
jgi:hypothetical protein